MFDPVSKNTAPHYVGIDSEVQNKLPKKAKGRLNDLDVSDATELTEEEEEAIAMRTESCDLLKLTVSAGIYSGLLLTGCSITACFPAAIIAGYYLYRYSRYEKYERFDHKNPKLIETND